MPPTSAARRPGSGTSRRRGRRTGAVRRPADGRRRPSRCGGMRRGAARSAGPPPSAASATRQRHLVAVRVRRPVGLVVDVVELADGAVAGLPHLRERLSRQRPHARRDRGSGELEHLRPPGPEVVVAVGARRSARPRRPRWNACEWALGIAGIAVIADTRPAPGPAPPPATAASASSTAPPGEWLIPVALRTSTIAAGTSPRPRRRRGRRSRRPRAPGGRALPRRPRRSASRSDPRTHGRASARQP